MNLLRILKPLVGSLVCGGLAFALHLAATAAQELPAAGREPPAEAPAPAKPQITISKETTYILKPLTVDGFPDYAGALNQRLGQGVTPANNANVLFWQAHGPHPEKTTMPPEFFALMGVAAPPETGEYFVSFAEFLKRKGIDSQSPKFNELLNQSGEASRRPWRKAEYPEVGAWLDANRKPLALVVVGTKRDKYFSPVIMPLVDGEPNGGLVSMLLPGVQASRDFARALTARAMLRLGEGKSDEAWQDLVACHRVGRRIGQGAYIVEKLVGIAIDSMAVHADLTYIEHVRPNREAAAACLADLAALGPGVDMARAIDETERCIFLDTTLLLARGRTEALTAVTGSDDGVFKLIPMDAVDWNVVLRMGNEWFDRLADAAKEGDRALQVEKIAKYNEELKALAAEARGLNLLAGLLTGGDQPRETIGKAIGRILVALLLPALEAAVTAEHRLDQNHAQLRLAFALAAYRGAKGSYPKKLAELTPKYLDKIPGDLFSGKQIVYRTADDGYLLYSIGANGIDEDGRYYDDQPPGDDLSIRMPRRFAAEGVERK